MQAKNRIFNGNSRSARTDPLKILTPASGVFVLLNSAPRSPKISSPALRKVHSAVCIQVFSALIQPALSQIIPNSTNKKQRQNFFDYSRLFIRFLLLKQATIPVFKHQYRTQFPYQPIKFCLRFFFFEFEIVSGENAAGTVGGSDGGPLNSAGT